jgi:hypothetical protein
MALWEGPVPYVLLTAVTLALYVPSLYFDFVWDDFAYVVNNYRIQGLAWINIKTIWSHSFLGHYAPVQHSFLAAIHGLSGLDPFGYHLGQVLVHATCVLLLYRILVKLESARVALLASLLYAVHPTHIETVAWVSESKSTLAFLFFLLSFRFFIRLRERGEWTDCLLAALFLTLSLLSKINTVVAPAIFLLYDYRQGATLRTLKWRSLALFFLISGGFTLVHLSSFHGTASEMESVYLGGPATHLMNLPFLLSFYLQMIVYPHPLSAWQMFPAQLQLDWNVGLRWVAFAALGVLLWRSRREVQFWGLWIFIFLLPVLQIIPFPIWVADRYLYIPLVGGCALIARWFFQAADRLAEWPRRALACAMAGAIVVMGWATVGHLPVWKNDLTLWTATTPTCMESSYCHMNLGVSLLRHGRANEGMRELIQAVNLRQSRWSLEHLGDGYTLTARDYAQAVIAYNMALEMAGPLQAGELFAKLARAHALAGEWEQAERAIESAKRFTPYDPNLWIVDGYRLWKLGMPEEATMSLRRALALTGGTVPPQQLFTRFLGDAAEVGQMLADLRVAPITVQ